jgi:uncharacterized protein YukE
MVSTHKGSPTMEKLADQLDQAADALTTVDRAVPGLVVPAGAFGADDAGLPGRIGRRLHAHWHAVLTARAREAAAASAQLSEMARSVRTTERTYAETDDSAADRVRREG